MTYHERLKEGETYQQFVRLQLLERYRLPIDYYTTKHEQFHIGESKQGIEVKLDNRCTETGRLSIELAEKTRAEQSIWAASGIFRKDNTVFYVQGNYDIIFFFSKKVLQRYYLKNKPEIHELPTIKKFYLPFRYCYILADIIIHPRMEQ